MKARLLTTATPFAGRFGHNKVQFAVLLGVVMIGFILASTLYRAQPSALVTAPATAGTLAALDQHERHPAGFTNIATPLDQHERHPGANVDSYTTLDQHERHPNGFAVNSYTTLDQHERHPALFTSKTGDAALPDALDRHLAARER